ncbi:right-handed parallel beta-helix repeat-containing protein [Novosphingobium mangrovi (ex Huang et al. 2023)]|uniref:Right-handed parallel beta-helix repeat-containing protein n=1 Tax=Novosphingobium mangrovi (ex Huang et al. 2023) TaxID=2976432 RepID=A0ABT2I160_9SPHN|nr:right-handed parallel beta-helix repeat-containing protein [Novosphingobium mangrovi (ex Huang et al. 2023)]MCT2398543.1 right-handed parallel beta-helix repeat-containing protein [Novosphingobium mangrovi (ex Huang et al. 2023)]
MDIIDLGGAVLDAPQLKSGRLYRNGSIRYATAIGAEDLGLDRVTIITGQGDGLLARSIRNAQVTDCEVVSDGVPKDSTRGLFFYNGEGITIERLTVRRARMGVVLRQITGGRISASDFSGISEDAVRLVSCSDVAIVDSDFHDFAADEEIGGTGLHPDSIQLFTDGAVPNRSITIEGNRMWQGAGSKFPGPFARYYADKPSPEKLIIRRNIILSRVGNGIVAAGSGEVTDNFVAGYADGPVCKISFAEDWNGPVTGNRAQHYVDKVKGFQAGWAPAGNEIIDPVADESMIDGWRAAPKPVLPAGLTNEMLAFLDARYGA